jgi:hypothetical protein
MLKKLLNYCNIGLDMIPRGIWHPASQIRYPAGYWVLKEDGYGYPVSVLL